MEGALPEPAHFVYKAEHIKDTLHKKQCIIRTLCAYKSNAQYGHFTHYIVLLILLYTNSVLFGAYVQVVR